MVSLSVNHQQFFKSFPTSVAEKDFQLFQGFVLGKPVKIEFVIGFFGDKPPAPASPFGLAVFVILGVFIVDFLFGKPA